MKTYSFETQPPPIPESEISEIVDTDIVVAGAGPAGLAAAASAAEKGARVVLIEKFHRIAAPGGPGAPFVGSKLQKERDACQAPGGMPAGPAGFTPPPGMPAPPPGMSGMGPGAAGGMPPMLAMHSESGPIPTKEELVEGLVKASAGRADERLVRRWADKSGEVADWLVDMADEQGLAVCCGRFSHLFSKPGCSPFHLNRTPIGCEENETELCLLNMIAEYGLQHGLEIRTSTAAVRLVRPGNQGRVLGLIAQKKDGTYVQFNAGKGVILCTGDYAMDDEMLEKYCSWALDVPKLLQQTVTGDGLKMGLWAGAPIEEAPHCAMLHFNSTNEKPVIHFRPVGMMNRAKFLYVNKRGERIANEAESDEFLANIVLRQPGKVFWQVFDSRWITEENREDVEKALATGAVLKADTIEALARHFGANPQVFMAAVNRYNELVKIGEDLDFGKDADHMTISIYQPPYYVCESPPNLLCVMGGFRRSDDGQVLDADLNVIPGLYAAGNITGGFWGDTYPMGFLGGISRSHALVFGRLSGLHAALA